MVKGHIYLSSDVPWGYHWNLCRVQFLGFQRRHKRGAFEFQDFSAFVRVFEFQKFQAIKDCGKISVIKCPWL